MVMMTMEKSFLFFLYSSFFLEMNLENALADKGERRIGQALALNKRKNEGKQLQKDKQIFKNYMTTLAERLNTRLLEFRYDHILCRV